MSYRVQRKPSQHPFLPKSWDSLHRLQYANDLKDTFGRRNVAEGRRFLASFIDKIWVSTDGIRIEYGIPGEQAGAYEMLPAVLLSVPQSGVWRTIFELAIGLMLRLLKN